MIIKVESLSYDDFQFQRWIELTKWMFTNFDAAIVYDYIDKSLADVSDRQMRDGFPKEIFDEDRTPRIIRSRGIKRKIIDSKLKISEVAKKYGLDVARGKCTCPFHLDSDPSLSFNDEKNVFHCFGCGVSGDIVEFFRLMEEQKRGKNGQKGSGE